MPPLSLSASLSNPDNEYLGSAEWGYRNVKGPMRGVVLEIRREREIELATEGDFRWYDLMRWKEGKCIEQQMVGMYFKGPGAGVQEEYDFDGNGTADVSIYNPAMCEKGPDGEPVPPATSAPFQYRLGSDMILSEVLSGYVNPVGNISRSFNEDRDYLFPIPTADLALNRSLTQNPGWPDGLSKQ
jgi:hypothetical protein